MKIYTFGHSSEKDIGRNYPQSQTNTLPNGKTVKDKDFVWNVEHLKLPSFEPFFGIVELTKGAKITDLISSVVVSNGFIISPKLLEIFNTVSLGSHIYYPITIHHKEEYYDYYWIHFVDSIDEIINVKETGFIIKEDFKKDKVVTINSLSRLKKKCWRLGLSQRIKTINLTLKKAPPVDCFYFEYLSHKLMISEHLRTKLLDNNVTGIQLYEKDFIIKS